MSAADVERARKRWESMSIAARCEWLLSELGPQLILWAEEKNPEHLPMKEAPEAFMMEAWGKRCIDLAAEVREECGKQKTKNLIITQ